MTDHDCFFPVVRPQFLGRHSNACNSIVNKNSIHQSDIELYKYWVKHSGYFRPATTAKLGTGITDGKLLLCHVISKENVDKTISTK